MSRKETKDREVLLRVKLPGPEEKEEKVTAYVTLTGETAVIFSELEAVVGMPRATLMRELIEEALEARQVRLETSGEPFAMELTERRELLDTDPDRFRVSFLVDELLKRCEEQVTQDAARALELAELAVDVSLRVDREASSSLSWYSRARAEAYRGNCLRLTEEPQAAHEAFRHAHKLYRRAKAPNPEVEAELKSLEASLAIDQRRFEEAEELLARSLSLYRELNLDHRVALTLIKRAHLASQRFEPAAGLDDLHEAAALLDPDEDSRHYLMVCFNLVLSALESGDIELARRYYDEHRELLESRSEPWFALRLLWLRAKMARAQAEPDTASELYRRARQGFLDEGLGYDAALVSVELASLQLELGDTQAVQQLAGEMLPIFQAQDVHREALAALVLFQQAVQTEELTGELIVDLRRYLQLARRDPRLKFEQV